MKIWVYNKKILWNGLSEKNGDRCLTPKKNSMDFCIIGNMVSKVCNGQNFLFNTGFALPTRV